MVPKFGNEAFKGT